MDYTKLPRELIYKERKDLEEFADGEETNFIIIDNMLSNLFFDGPDGKERALKCLNTAYYICTLILLCKKRPEWDFNYYCEIANCTYDNHKDLINQGFTLSLVYLYLTHTYYDAQCPKLLNILKDYIDSHSLDFSLYDIYPFSYALKTISKGLSNDFHIAEEFNPRRIRRDIFREIESHRGCIWNKLTDNYREEETKKLIEAIGKDEEEKHIIIELINSDAERFYGIDNFYYKENVKPMLDEMDRQICSENIEASTNDTAIQKPAPNNDHTQDENQKIIEKQEKRIKELEEEIKKLNEKINELGQASSSDKIDELIIAFLTPLFYDDEKDASDFLKQVKGKDNEGIIDVVWKFKQKIMPSTIKRKLWTILTTTKIYSASESNWNILLKNKEKKENKKKQ